MVEAEAVRQAATIRFKGVEFGSLGCWFLPICFACQATARRTKWNTVEPPATFPTEVPTLWREPGPPNGLCRSTPVSPLFSQRRIRSHFVGGLIHRRRVSVLPEHGGFFCARGARLANPPSTDVALPDGRFPSTQIAREQTSIGSPGCCGDTRHKCPARLSSGSPLSWGQLRASDSIAIAHSRRADAMFCSGWRIVLWIGILAFLAA